MNPYESPREVCGEGFSLRERFEMLLLWLLSVSFLGMVVFTGIWLLLQIVNWFWEPSNPIKLEETLVWTGSGALFCGFMSVLLASLLTIWFDVFERLDLRTTRQTHESEGTDSVDCGDHVDCCSFCLSQKG